MKDFIKYVEVPISIGDTVYYEKDNITGVVEKIWKGDKESYTKIFGTPWDINIDRLKLIKSSMIS